MNRLPYYKAYPRDFIEGTIGMPFELKAAYRLVLDLIYMQGGKLPDDARYISGLLGCSLRKWRTLRADLISLGKIDVVGDALTNKRADIELDITRKLIEKQTENRSRPNKIKDLQSPRSNHTDTDTDNTSSLRSDVKARAPRQSQKDFVSELSGLLDAETIEAIVDHRKKKRAPITARAGMLMAKELRKCPCPQEAADMMLLHGWQGIKAEWVQNRQPQRRKEPPPRQRNIGDAIRDEARRLGVLTDEPDHPDTRLQQNSHTAGNVTVLDLAFKPAFKSFG